MTHDTDPDDASIADIEAALRGQMFTQLQRIDGCRRCQEKNQKRRHVGVDPVDHTFSDGDDVILHAVHRDESELADGYWLITAAAHRKHPQLPFDDAVSRDADMVRARACVRERPEDCRKHFVDVDVIERSRAGDGPVQSVVERRRQSQIADDGPDDMTVIDIKPGEAPAHWPPEDRQWLENLADVFEMERRTDDIEKGASPGANPRGDGAR